MVMTLLTDLVRGLCYDVGLPFVASWVHRFISFGAD